MSSFVSEYLLLFIKKRRLSVIQGFKQPLAWNSSMFFYRMTVKWPLNVIVIHYIPILSFSLQFPMSRSLGIEISLLSLLPQSNYAVSCHKVWSRRLISNGGTTITICLWPPQLSALEMSKGQDYKPHHQSILLKALRSALWPSCTLRLQIRGHILACRLSWSQLLSAFTFWKVS